MALVSVEVYEQHKSLMITLCEMMDPNDQTYKNFIYYLESYIPKGRLSTVQQNPTDVFSVMEETRVLEVGKYQNLEKALEASGYINILDVLKEEEENITNQLRKRGYSDGSIAGSSSYIDAATTSSIEPEEQPNKKLRKLEKDIQEIKASISQGTDQVSAVKIKSEIDHLKEDLKSCYRSLSTVPISVYHEEETIPLESFYVDMDITLDRKKLSSYKQIFLERRNQRIILTGLSGSGKSTFCRKIVNTWCMEEPKKENETGKETDPSIPDSQEAMIDRKEKGQLVPENPAAIGDQMKVLSISSSYDASTDEIDSPVVTSQFVIDRELPLPVRDSSETIEDQDVLLQFLLLFYIYAPKVSTEKTLIEVLYNQCLKRESDRLSKILEEQPEKVLIILDGIDEMGDIIPPFLSDLLGRKLHPRIIVLMAMRPWKISQLRLKPSSHYDLLLDVQGLSEVSALKFIQNVIDVSKTHLTVERPIGNPAFEEEDVLSSLKNIPILVLFLTHIWCQDQCLPKRRHDLYKKILECLIKRCLNKTGNKYTPVLTEQDDTNIKIKQFWELYINGSCQAAHDFLLKGVSGPTVVMQEKDLMNKLGTNAQLKLGALLDCGILSKQDAFSPLEKKVSVTFLHLSIHEFLTSKHLVNNDDAFQNFLTSLKTLNDVLRYENLFVFICGHNAKKGHEAFTRICQVCDEDPLVIQYRHEMGYNDNLEITDSVDNLMEIYRACLNEMDTEELIEMSDIYFVFEHTIEMPRLRSCYVKSLFLYEIELDLDSLYCMTNLTSLKLDDVQLLGGVLELGKLSNLTTLTMKKINKPCSVHDLRSLTNLTFLTLQDVTMSNGVLDLRSLNKLTFLTLQDITMSNGVLDLKSLTNLTFLTLQDVTMSNGVLDLRGLTNLTFLTLQDVTMCNGVNGLSSLTNLTSLRLSSITMPDDVLDLSRLTNLTSLVLQWLTMPENVLDLSSLTKLTSLVLFGEPDKCFRCLCSNISLCTCLERIQLQHITLCDGALDLSRLTNLSYLTLKSVTMSEECMQCLCSSICSCTHLESLELEGITLHEHVLDLSNLTNLTHLELNNVTMSEKCSSSLYTSISACTDLYLINMRLPDGVLDLTHLSGLERLFLYYVTMSSQCQQTLQDSSKRCCKFKIFYL